MKPTLYTASLLALCLSLSACMGKTSGSAKQEAESADSNSSALSDPQAARAVRLSQCENTASLTEVPEKWNEIPADSLLSAFDAGKYELSFSYVHAALLNQLPEDEKASASLSAIVRSGAHDTASAGGSANILCNKLEHVDGKFQLQLSPADVLSTHDGTLSARRLLTLNFEGAAKQELTQAFQADYSADLLGPSAQEEQYIRSSEADVKVKIYRVASDEIEVRKRLVVLGRESSTPAAERVRVVSVAYRYKLNPAH